MSDAAIAQIVSGTVTIVVTLVGFLTLWIKLKYGVQKAEEAANRVGVVESKLDENTDLTKKGTKAAADNAAIAASTATEAKEVAKEAVDTINKKLNGGLDVAIESAIKPIRDTIQDHMAAFQEHAIQDDRNMKEIRASLADLHEAVKSKENRLGPGI